MLELRGVEKSYEGRSIVGPLDLTAERGRTTVLIGPSGCGKSTLLRLMVGLVAADRGEVRLGGELVTKESALMLRRRMGYVIQDGGLFPHLAARDNVALAATYLGWDAPRIEARMRELAQLVHLDDAALDRFPAQLSGGQRQRVSLMRALMLGPEVLLLDEPLGALDPMIRADLQAELRVIFRALATTVVLVTHDIAEAAYLGDTIVVLRDGSIVQQGSIADLVRAPSDPFIERFLRAQRSHLDGLREADA